MIYTQVRCLKLWVNSREKLLERDRQPLAHTQLLKFQSFLTRQNQKTEINAPTPTIMTPIRAHVGFEIRIALVAAVKGALSRASKLQGLTPKSTMFVTK